MKYWCITTRGIEDISKSEISSAFEASSVLEVSYRKIVLESDAAFEDVTSLRSIEDAFMYVGEVTQIGHTKQDLHKLTDSILAMNFSDSLTSIRSHRSPRSFSISASSVGKRNFSMPQLKDALRIPLARKLGMPFEDVLHEDFDIRIFLEHKRALIGVRLSTHPLHRRAYKTETTPGSLKPNIAYALCFLAEIEENTVLLDPLCGSGTIIAESLSFQPQEIYANDIDPLAITIARENADSLNSGKKIPIRWSIGDARNLPLDDNTVGAIVTNLPFGKQVAVGDIERLYEEALRELARVAKRNSRIVLLTTQDSAMQNAIEKCMGLSCAAVREISLHGEIAKMYKLIKL